jgi:signal transduction histidine kinase
LLDLVTPLEQEGTDARVEVADDLELPPEVSALFFRAAQESLRNVSAHARARHVWVRVRSEGGQASIEVEDDGRGFTLEQARAAREEGHLGLRLLEDLARDAHGTLDIDHGTGTRIRLEVPLA